MLTPVKPIHTRRKKPARKGQKVLRAGVRSALIRQLTAGLFTALR